MRGDDLPLAILGLLGFVALTPALVHYVRGFEALSGSPPPSQFIAGLVVPAILMLLISSWINPQASRIVTGLFLVVSAMALAPFLWRMAGMASNQLVNDPLAQTAMEAALPLLLLAAAIGLGWGRLAEVAR